MKRLVVAIAIVVILGSGGWVAWHYFAASEAPPFAEQFPTVAAACPDDANDLAGIEGWAPGAGKAEKIGQTGTGNIGGFGAALGGGSETPAPAATGCHTLAPEAAAYFERVAQLRDAIPNVGDPAAVGASLADAGAIFAYVRDGLHTEAYAGTMRGQLGALAAGGGSSADKALVMGALLAGKDIPVRYLHAQLDAADAAAVVDAALTPTTGAADPGLAQQLAAKFSVDLSAARAQYDAARAALLQRQNAALDDARPKVSALAAQLAAAGHPLASTDSQRAVLLADVRDHWWVQAQIGGTWIDLDPTLPGAKQGTHLGPAPAGDPLTDMPASLNTEVTVRILAQTLDATGAHEATIVQGSATTADLYARPIEIGLGDRSNGAFDPAKIASFVPSIEIGGSTQTGDPIVPDPSGGARLGMLRLQIVTSVPGSSPVTEERVLLDRRSADHKSIDTAWTPAATAYAMTQHRSLLAMTGDFSDIFALKTDLTNTLRYGAAAAYALAGGSGVQVPPADLGETFPVEAMRFFQRDAAVRRILEDKTTGPGLRFLYTAPMMAGVSRGFALVDGRPNVIERFDIVSNAMTAAGSAGAATANAIRGYEDTVLEQSLLGVPSDGGTPALMAAAASNGVPTAVRSDAAHGGLTIAPERAVAMGGRGRVGWWQIDPASGNLVGRMDDGSGQALSEYVTQMNDTMSMYSAISFYADMLRCQVLGITSPLRGEGGPDAAMAYLDCMKSAACSFLTGFAAGELYAREDADLQALAYNILDLSFDTHLGVSKGSWAPPGVWCSKYAPSP